MKFRMTMVVAGMLGATLMSSPAAAEWLEVSSTNFRFYSQGKESDAVETVTNLETLDKIVRTVTGNKQPPSPLPLTVFELKGIDDVQATIPGGGGAGVAAYYNTSDQGAYVITFRDAVTSKIDGSRLSRTYNINAEVTQHEYMHHLMFQYFPTNYPTWYPEGFAEYYGTVQFEPNNVVVVGHAPVGRLEAMNDWLDVKTMLTAKSYADVTNLSGLYAQGWLLTHMAASRPEVGKQVAQYLSAVAKGTPYEQAATAAFGDLKKFNSELRDYRSKVTALSIKLNGIDPGKIEVRKLSSLEEKLLPVEVKLRTSVKISELDGLAGTVRSHLASAPDDPYGLGVQATVEFLAGDFDRAQGTVDRLLNIDPDSVRGNIVSGRLKLRSLKAANTTDAGAWDAARQPLIKAFTINPTATEPMIHYYRSYIDQGILPADAAQNALVEAFRLMPRNDEIRYLVARDFEMRGLIKDAIFTISPAAFGTFDGDERVKKRRDKLRREYSEKYTNAEFYESALEMLKRLEAKRDGNWNNATNSFITPPTPDKKDE